MGPLKYRECPVCGVVYVLTGGLLARHSVRGAADICEGSGKHPPPRAAAPGEDWSEAGCRNIRTPKGPCCFCGQQITRRHGFMATYRGERAHYMCAPALGVAVVALVTP